jgi:hypothetical protein
LYCISNKDLVEECDNEENLAVTGAATIAAWKEDCKKFCPMSRIRPATARPAPQWKMCSECFAWLPICVKIYHSQCYLVATVIDIQPKRIQICVCICTYTYSSQYKDDGMGQRWMPRVFYFGHACHRIVYLVLYEKKWLFHISLLLVSWIGSTFHLASPFVCSVSIEELGRHVTVGTVRKWKI